MPWNGSGVFNRIHSWISDAAAGLKISSTRMDADTNDIADGITNCLAKDGQNSPTANINWGNFQITNLAAGSNPSDAATVQQTVDTAYFDNWLDNVNFLFLDRGTMSANPGVGRHFYCDRWSFTRSPTTGYTVSRSTIGSYNYLVINRTPADASGSEITMMQSLGVKKSTEFKAQGVVGGSQGTIGVSFALMKGVGATFTHVDIDIIQHATASANNDDGAWTEVGGAKRLTVAASSLSTTTPSVHAFTTSMASITGNAVGVKVTVRGYTGAAPASDDLYVGQPRLSLAGNAGTPSYRPKPYEVELVNCRRFFVSIGGNPSTGNKVFAGTYYGHRGAAGTVSLIFPFSVPMDSEPSGGSVSGGISWNTSNCTPSASNDATIHGITWSIGVTAPGDFWIQQNASASLTADTGN